MVYHIYVATFIVLQNIVVDSNYSMLLGRPWFKYAKVTHDQDNNAIIVQGNGTIRAILVNKKLGVETKRPQTLVCYDSLEGLTNEEEDIFETKPKLFSIGIIIVLDEIVSLPSIGVSEIRINEEYDPKQRTSNQRATEVVPSTTKPKDFYVRLEISLEDKVYPKTYYHHSQIDIEMDETPTKIQVQNLQIISQTLIEEQQRVKFNFGT